MLKKYTDKYPSIINTFIQRKINNKKNSSKKRSSTKLTDAQYRYKLKINNPCLEPLEPYINANTPILHRCNQHDVIWKIRPSDALCGKGCKQCRKDKLSKQKSKTTVQYKEELQNACIPYEPIEDYKGANVKIKHICLIHDCIFIGLSANILFRGTGCPECGQRKHRTHQQYIDDLRVIMPFILPREEFQGMNVPILHYCSIHDIEWRASPSNILYQKCGCPECGKEKIGKKNSKTHDEYVQQLANINPYLEVIEPYINSTTPILHRCKRDQYEWKTCPVYVLYGTGCPICSESHGEREIRKWLDKHNINYEYQKKFVDCKDIRILPFDFYLPDLNKCIEYDGKQHYESVDFFGGNEQFQIRKKHDEIKNQYCKDNNMDLLRISYDKDIVYELNNFLFI